MYTPRYFAMDEIADQHALIDACDFGVVVSTGPDGFFATHIPMMLALYKRGKLPVQRLRSGFVSLDEINVGFDRLAEGSVLRQILRPNS